jgi:hypothetical protein
MGQDYVFGRAGVLSALRTLSHGCLTLPQKRTGSRRNDPGRTKSPSHSAQRAIDLAVEGMRKALPSGACDAACSRAGSSSDAVARSVRRCSRESTLWSLSVDSEALPRIHA